MRSMLGHQKRRIAFFTLAVLILACVLGGVRVSQAAAETREPSYTFILVNDTNVDLLVNGTTKIPKGEGAPITAGSVQAVSTNGFYEVRVWETYNASDSIEGQTLSLGSAIEQWGLTVKDGNLFDIEGPATIVVRELVRVLTLEVVAPDPSQKDITGVFPVTEIAQEANAAMGSLGNSVSSDYYRPAEWEYRMINEDGSRDLFGVLPSEDEHAGTYVRVLVRPVFTLTMHNGDGSISYESAVKGESYGLAKPPDFEGYRFLGFDPDPNAIRVKYPAGKPYSVDGNEELYVITRKIHDVTFDYNGSGQEAVLEIVVDGDTVAFPDADARSGYLFLGWAEDPKATSPAYAKGDSLTISSERTFYAVWAKETTSIGGAGTYYLQAGHSYTLTKRMKLSGDPGIYEPGSFFVPSDGYYTFAE